MNKSAKITLLIVTLVFVGITAWRVVDWSTRSMERSRKQVVSITLEGPDVVRLGEFDENLYVIRMKHVDGSESEAPFKAAFMDKTEYDKLSVAGTHEIVFTFEKCRGTFKITVVSE